MWDLSQGYARSQHEQNAEAVPERLQHISSLMVLTSRVSREVVFRKKTFFDLISEMYYSFSVLVNKQNILRTNIRMLIQSLVKIFHAPLWLLLIHAFYLATNKAYAVRPPIQMQVVLFVCRSYGDFQSYSREKKNKTYISKPEAGCQGRGIWLTKNPREVKSGEHMLLQVYMTKVCHGNFVGS